MASATPSWYLFSDLCRQSNNLKTTQFLYTNTYFSPPSICHKKIKINKHSNFCTMCYCQGKFPSLGRTGNKGKFQQWARTQTIFLRAHSHFRSFKSCKLQCEATMNRTCFSRTTHRYSNGLRFAEFGGQVNTTCVP